MDNHSLALGSQTKSDCGVTPVQVESPVLTLASLIGNYTLMEYSEQGMNGPGKWACGGMVR